jgi:hypothetical protein
LGQVVKTYLEESGLCILVAKIVHELGDCKAEIRLKTMVLINNLSEEGVIIEAEIDQMSVIYE